MKIFQVVILSIVQGAAELLPVSSSAHVIIAEKIMGLDPTKPEMTLLLVMLHTGTMFAVIFFFWKSWKTSFFSSCTVFKDSIKLLCVATVLTGIIAVFLKYMIEKFVLRNLPNAEIELIFGNLTLMSVALAAVGMLILYSGIKNRRIRESDKELDLKASGCIGIVQGICIPFRGFSRSGATISTGMLLSISRRRVEEFSFALAVVLTPPIIVREVVRLLKEQSSAVVGGGGLFALFLPSLLGMAMSFIAGILALKWLSTWLDTGRWYIFGIYCLCLSGFVWLLKLYFP